jgi:hypothetical protein
MEQLFQSLHQSKLRHPSLRTHSCSLLTL